MSILSEENRRLSQAQTDSTASPEQLSYAEIKLAPSGAGQVKRKGRGRTPKPPLDISSLREAGEAPVFEIPYPYLITCQICGSTRNVSQFKRGKICVRCIKKIKTRYN